MNRIISVQTLMTEEELVDLKNMTEESTTKEAIRVAIDFYIEQHRQHW